MSIIRVPRAILVGTLARAIVKTTWALVVIVTTVQSDGATTYDNTPYYQVAVLNGFGPESTVTNGETFVAPADPVLQDFTFFLGITPGHLSIQADVFNWSGPLLFGTGGQAIGNPLFQSPSMIFDSTNQLQPFTVHTGGTILTPGNPYVMLLTVSNPSDYAASSGSVYLGEETAPEPGDGGGSLHWDHNGNNFSLLTSAPWTGSLGNIELEFVAHFTAVPEPSTFALAALGAATLYLGRRVGAQRKAPH
jgi:hypothetical protein